MIFRAVLVLCAVVLSKSFPLKNNALKINVPNNLRGRLLWPSLSSLHQGTSLKSYNSYGPPEEKGLSLKVLATLSLLLVGVFGTGFVGFFKNTLPQIIAPSTSKASSDKLKNTGERGALTRMTRKEITGKLAQLPVFFATSDNGASIYTAEGKGFLFSEKEDAEKFASNQQGLKVSATSLDDVFFTLYEKKAKIGKFITGVSSTSDPSAAYVLQGSSGQIAKTSDEWKQNHPADFPLFRVPNLVFSKEEGLEIPLFTRKEDALLAFEKLQETKAQEGKPISKEPEVQVTSLLDIVALFESGGFQSRSIEFYPSMESLEAARAIMFK